MLVKFDPTIGTASTPLRLYNFMRIITAVATAAVNSTPVVRPMTSQNTFNNSLNCITEVIANSEGGGWQVSGTNDTNGHNLPDATYTDANLNNKVYRADFFRNSGKAQYPYLKFTVLPQLGTGTQGTLSSYPYMDIIAGAHVDTRYNAQSGYAPSNLYSALASVNLTLTSNNTTTITSHGIRPIETGVGTGTAGQSRSEWIMAVTENYFILIQPWTSMTYFGLRTTQPWETGYDDNPPIVGWHTPTWIWSTVANMPKKMMAFWRLRDGTGAIRPQPYLSFNQELTSAYNYVTASHSNPQYTGNEELSLGRISSDGRGAPLFYLKANRDYNSVSGSQPFLAQGTYGGSTTNGIQYWPTTDPATGVQVPCAVPINMQMGISENTTTDQSQMYFNQGGRCLGIFKSLSGSDAFMNNFYTPGQNFVVDGENYYPVLTGSSTTNRDMFLIRRY
jgi:hypothetical protein